MPCFHTHIASLESLFLVSIRGAHKAGLGNQTRSETETNSTNDAIERAVDHNHLDFDVLRAGLAPPIIISEKDNTAVQKCINKFDITYMI